MATYNSRVRYYAPVAKMYSSPPKTSNQATVIVSGASALAEPLDSFTRFPNLPAEMRLKIWGYALPTCVDKNGRRIVSVKVEFLRKPDKMFSVALRMDTSDHRLGSTQGKVLLSTSPEVYDIGMTRTCVESRAVYLFAFPHVLPLTIRGPGNGRKTPVLRYNNETVILISNFAQVTSSANTLRIGRLLLPKSYSQHVSLGPWTVEVKNLAIYVNQDSYINRQWFQPIFGHPGQYENGTALLLAYYFKNVEALTLVHDAHFGHGNRSFMTELRVTILGAVPREGGEETLDIDKVYMRYVHWGEVQYLYDRKSRQYINGPQTPSSDREDEGETKEEAKGETKEETGGDTEVLVETYKDFFSEPSDEDF